MVQAVSRRLYTAEARIRSHVNQRGVNGGEKVALERVSLG
jgi:hypothetical protein